MTTRALARAGLVVTAAFLGSRLLGWLRMVVITQQFPESRDLDAYLAAFRIPDLMYQLVAAGAVGSALIPVLTGLLTDGTPGRAWRVASTVINLMLAALLVISLIVAIWAPVIVPWLVGGFDDARTEQTIRLTRLMLLSPIFLALGALASAILNTRGRFGVAAMAPIVYNLAIIGACVVLAPGLGLDALALGVVLGSFLHLAIQLPLLHTFFAYHPRIDLGDPAARKALWLMLPRAIGLGVTQITFVVNTSLAATLPEGSVTAYFLAFTILQIPLGVVGFPLGVVLLPSLSQAIASARMDDFRVLVERSVRLLLWATLFLATVGIALREPTTELLFANVSADVLTWTASTYAWFLLGLPAHAINVVLTRAFYSAQDTRTPVTVACLSVAVNVIVSLLTVASMGLHGLALGVAVGGWFETLTLSAILWRRTHAVPLASIARGAVASLVGAVLAGVVSAVVLYVIAGAVGMTPGRVSALVELAAAGSIAGGCYLLYSRQMRIPELSQAIRLVRSALRRE